MQLGEFVSVHSGKSKLTFLLLYEATLLGEWLQTFRQTVRVLLSKGQMSKSILLVGEINTILLRKVRKPLPNDEGV
jgi:hypothetical protein